MAAPTREEVYAALKAQLDTLKAAVPVPSGKIVDVSRVWRPWEDLAGTDVQQPIIYIVQTKNKYSQDKGSPQLRTLSCDLVLYAKRGSELTDIATGVGQLSAILDAIDVALKPDPTTGTNTLGGLVSHCWVTGEATIYEGTLGDQMIAVLPVEILLNQDSTSPPKHYFFDAGSLYITPVTQQDGQPANLSAPVRFANLKGVTIEATGELITSPSQLRHAIRMAKGRVTIKVRARFGTFDGVVMDQAFFEANQQPGATRYVEDEAHTVPGIPFVFAASVPAGGTWMTNLGVAYRTTGQPLKLVTGVPVVGQYVQSAPGSYTFAAADTGALVAISYLYTVATGKKIVVANLFKGVAPMFQAILVGRYNDQQVTWVLEACSSERFQMPTLLEQFTIMDFEFQAYADLNGNVGTISAG